MSDAEGRNGLASSGTVGSGPQLVTLEELKAAADRVWRGIELQEAVEDASLKEFRATHGQHVHGDEVVGIGFKTREQDAEALWWRCTNVAEVGSRTFKVTWEEVHSVIQAAREIFGGKTWLVASIWHSHYDNVAPSHVDIASFPEWCKRGMVYHAPTQTTSTYDKTGIISGLTTDLQSALDKQE